MDYLNVKGKPSFYRYGREMSNGHSCPGWGVVRKNFGALTGVAEWRLHPESWLNIVVQSKGSPFQLLVGRMQEAAHRCFSHTWIFLSLSFSLLPPL